MAYVVLFACFDAQTNILLNDCLYSYIIDNSWTQYVMNNTQNAIRK